jgi:hypothetical protein
LRNPFLIIDRSRNPIMKLEDLLQSVDRRWHEEFLRFIETGEAGDEFLRYLDHDKGGQQAVEMAFNAQAAAFEGLAEELKKGPQVKEPMEAAAAASARIVEAMEVVVQLPPDQREVVARKAASALEASLEPDQRKRARSVVRNLEEALEKAAASGHTLAAGE